MRGELIPMVFIVLLAAASLLGFIFYNIFYGTKYQIQVFHIRTMDVIRNVLEDFKNYIHLALTYSSHQSLREHACKGGIIRVEDRRVIVAPWICNSPNPVSVDSSKNCLGRYTRYYLNIYLGEFNTSLPLRLLKTNFSECIYDVNGVLSGKYDDGNFLVNCFESRIEIFGKDINLYEKVNTSDFISRTRYWYLFRIFTEWAMDNVYAPCVCSKIGCACSASSGEETCSPTCLAEVEDCAQKALEDLQRRFDKYVKCEKRRICCTQGRGPSCLPPSPCLAWNNRLCSIHCENKCFEPPAPEKICQLQFSSYQSYEETPNLQGYLDQSSDSSQEGSSLECFCVYWYEARLAAAYEFRCTDYKYYVPTSRGPVPLTFAVSAYAFWRDQDVCRGKNICRCPKDAVKCDECTPVDCCTPCQKAQ